MKLTTFILLLFFQFANSQLAEFNHQNEKGKIITRQDFEYVDRTGKNITIVGYKKFPIIIDSTFFKNEVSGDLFKNQFYDTNGGWSFNVFIELVKIKSKKKFHIKVQLQPIRNIDKKEIRSLQNPYHYLLEIEKAERRYKLKKIKVLYGEA